jgi:RNA polymerase sigma-70 factor (ECF subfamily)
MAAVANDEHAAWRPEPDHADGLGGDERLTVARARRDPAAFAPLYERYLPDVYRYCHYRLGSREAAEDVTSQTFIKAMANLGQFRGGSFRAWLFTTAHRTVIDHVRARRPDLPLDAAEEALSAEVSPETAAVAGDEQRQLAALLAQLPPDQRRVVELRLAGLNDREIAAVLGQRHTAVRTRQSRALARLRTLATESGWLAAREDPAR